MEVAAAVTVTEVAVAGLKAKKRRIITTATDRSPKQISYLSKNTWYTSKATACNCATSFAMKSSRICKHMFNLTVCER